MALVMSREEKRYRGAGVRVESSEECETTGADPFVGETCASQTDGDLTDGELLCDNCEFIDVDFCC